MTTELKRVSLSAPLVQPNLGAAIRRQLGVLGRLSLPAISVSVFVFLYAPIAVLVFFSFNSGTRLGEWEGFSLQWYEKVFASRDWMESLGTTLSIATTSMIFSTVLGTLGALALERSRFKGKNAYDGVMYLPVIIPDIVMALSLLLFFSSAGIQLSRWTVLFGHVAFNTAFVAVMIRARLASMDPKLEEAASDLYANAWQAFWRITFPLLRPAIIGGALMAFTMSFDEFVITAFVSGTGDATLPVRIYSMMRFGLRPELNAVASLVLILSITLVVASLVLQNRGKASAAK